MEYLDGRRDIAATLQIPEGRAYTFGFLNLAAPSKSTNADMELFGAMASCLSKSNNLMAVAMPQFGYKKGQLYMASRLVEDMFVLRGLKMDLKWALSFKSKAGARDTRSLVCDGRLVVPTEIKEADFVFKNTPHRPRPHRDG